MLALAILCVTNLGFISEQLAGELGYTHHGHYLGPPVWVDLRAEQSKTAYISSKWLPLELIIPLMIRIDRLCQFIRNPKQPTKFGVWVGRAISS